MHTDNAYFAANIPKYFVYTILKGLNFGIFTAVWVIFLQQQHNMSLTQVTLTDAAFWIAATLGELPTGVVADRYGRKASIAIGAALMGVSVLAFAFAPTVPLIIASFVALAIGLTFLSGAEDAFLFESLKIVGRAADYTRVAGRVSATTLAALAVGNVASGLLASVDLHLPFILSALFLFSMLGIVLTFREPRVVEPSGEAGEQRTRLTYWGIIKKAVAIMRARPALRYPIFYLTLVPIAAMALETVFLQPQALALGVPLAGVGVVVMAVQLSSMAGSTSSHRLKQHLGESKTIYFVPLAIAISLLLLGLSQQLPTLVFAATISFCTAVVRPIVMSRIQNQVSDNIRATVLSMQSLLFAFVVAFVEPAMGYVADLRGLPYSYYLLAGGLVIALSLIFWRGRGRFP
jgi:MFS family permease